MSTMEQRMQVLTMVKQLSIYFEKSKDKLCEPYNFTSIQATILLDLNGYGKSRVTSICKRLGKSTNTISPMLQRLEKQGYIKRLESEGDRRVTYIQLSNKGKRIMTDYMKDAGAYSWPIFDKFSEEEFEGMYNSLKKITSIISEEE